MSSNHQKKKSSYFLRTQSRIVNGENIIPFNSTIKSKNKNKNKTLSKNKKNNTKKFFGDSLSGNKKSKIKKFINDIEPSSYRGIDLNKVSGYSHSPNKLNISTKNFQQKRNILNEDKNIEKYNDKEIDVKQNDLYDEYNYNKKPYSDRANSQNNYNINNNKNINIYNNMDNNIYNNNQLYSKHKNDYYLNNNDLEINNSKYSRTYCLNNDNNLKTTYFDSYKMRNKSYVNELQYQNSIPSNIPENEIIKNPRESMSIMNMDLINKNNSIILNKNSRNESKIFSKINKLKNEIISPDINNNNIYNKSFNCQNNNKTMTYSYNEKNFHNNNNLTNINKENYPNNIYNKQENDINNYNCNYQINNKVNNDLELNKSIATLNNNFSLLKNNQFNATLTKNKDNLSTKILLNALSDFNSTNNFMRTFSPKNKLFFGDFNNNTFNYENSFNPKKNLEAHNFFGIQVTGNRLEQLLKSIPRHKKDNQIQNYNNNYALHKLYKDKKIEKKSNKYKSNIYILNEKTINEELTNVMPPNKINYE